MKFPGNFNEEKSKSETVPGDSVDLRRTSIDLISEN